MKNTDSVSTTPAGFAERQQQPENRGLREASYEAHAANMRRVMYSSAGIIFFFSLFLMVNGEYKAITGWFGMDVSKMDQSARTVTLLCCLGPFLLGVIVSGVVLCRSLTTAKAITNIVRSESNN